jgi:hypothetical protein|tara:strand:- start:74 stop:691 length:618 start_codon:yes stop_codon:yes gene_type:complete
MKQIPCKIHKLKYLIDPETPSQCAHPQCIINSIAHTAKRGKKTKILWQMICAKNLQEDCGSYVIEELLSYCKKKKDKGQHWYPLINWHWLRFKLLNFVDTHINKKNCDVELLEDIADASITEASFVVDNEHKDNAYRKLLYKEVADYVEGKYGAHWVLYLQDAISMLDVVKIESERFSVISPKAKAIKKDVFNWAHRRYHYNNKD